MIVFLTISYVALLAILVKVGVIRLTLFWKLTPLFWMFLLLVLLFIPMQWGAPAGTVTMIQVVQEIVPNVSGKVIEVLAKPLVPMKKGEVIFKIDPTSFEARVADIEAQLDLAKLRLSQSKRLVKAAAGSKYELQQYEAQVRSLEAKLKAARWDLAETIVRAPADGRVVALTLRPGQRVTSMPLRAFVTYVMDEQLGLVMGVHQNQLRHVSAGQRAEVVLKLFPGRVISAKVERVAYVSAQGQHAPSGHVPVIPLSQMAAPYGVVLTVDEGELDSSWINTIPGGAVGKAAVYTKAATMTHLIRKVMIRMDAWLNYINPF